MKRKSIFENNVQICAPFKHALGATAHLALPLLRDWVRVVGVGMTAQAYQHNDWLSSQSDHLSSLSLLNNPNR